MAFIPGQVWKVNVIHHIKTLKEKKIISTGRDIYYI